MPGEETPGALPVEGPDCVDSLVRELKDRLQLELRRQGEEQCQCVRTRREQQAAEVPSGPLRGQAATHTPLSAHPKLSFLSPQQVAKMMELAKEKHAAELKTLKETSEMYDPSPLSPSPGPSCPKLLPHASSPQ